MVPSLLQLSCELSVSVKESPDRKKMFSGNFAQQNSDKKIHTRKLPYVSNTVYNIGLENECFYVAPNIGYSYVTAKITENTNHLQILDADTQKSSTKQVFYTTDALKSFE